MVFDLRTVSTTGGQEGKNFNIKQNTTWLASICQLITESHKAAHVQSGIGVEFPYTEKNRQFLTNGAAVADATALIWESLLPLAKLMGTKR
jgi:hypothetical protein